MKVKFYFSFIELYWCATLDPEVQEKNSSASSENEDGLNKLYSSSNLESFNEAFQSLAHGYEEILNSSDKKENNEYKAEARSNDVNPTSKPIVKLMVVKSQGSRDDSLKNSLFQPVVRPVIKTTTINEPGKLAEVEEAGVKTSPTSHSGKPITRFTWENVRSILKIPDEPKYTILNLSDNSNGNSPNTIYRPYLNPDVTNDDMLKSIYSKIGQDSSEPATSNMQNESANKVEENLDIDRRELVELGENLNIIVLPGVRKYGINTNKKRRWAKEFSDEQPEKRQKMHDSPNSSQNCENATGLPLFIKNNRLCFKITVLIRSVLLNYHSLDIFKNFNFQEWIHQRVDEGIENDVENLKTAIKLASETLNSSLLKKIVKNADDESAKKFISSYRSGKFDSRKINNLKADAIKRFGFFIKENYECIFETHQAKTLIKSVLLAAIHLSNYCDNHLKSEIFKHLKCPSSDENMIYFFNYKDPLDPQNSFIYWMIDWCLNTSYITKVYSYLEEDFYHGCISLNPSSSIVKLLIFSYCAINNQKYYFYCLENSLITEAWENLMLLQSNQSYSRQLTQLEQILKSFSKDMRRVIDILAKDYLFEDKRDFFTEDANFGKFDELVYDLIESLYRIVDRSFDEATGFKKIKN